MSSSADEPSAFTTLLLQTKARKVRVCGSLFTPAHRSSAARSRCQSITTMGRVTPPDNLARFDPDGISTLNV
jgi:hypothetical protein